MDTTGLTPARRTFGAIGIVLLALVAALLPQVWIGIGLGVYSELAGVSTDKLLSSDNLGTTFMIAGVSALGTIALTSWFLMIKRGKRLPLNWRRRPSLAQLGGVLLTFAAYAAVAATAFMLVEKFVPSIDLEQAQELGFETAGTQVELLLTFIALVILAPLSEELLFRGFLFGNLQRFIGLWPAAIGSSLLFAAAHGQFNVAIDTFIMGLFCTYLFVRTKSIWPAILLHLLKNSLAYVMLFIVKT